MAAVVEMGVLRFSGVLAWWFWLLAHLFFLVGFRNRSVVLLNWSVAYWTPQRAARIIPAGTTAIRDNVTPGRRDARASCASALG